MLKILGRGTSSNVQKLLWLLGELAVPFEREDIGGRFGGTQTEAYLSLNPNGVVPTLIHDGFVLWESNSICRYLATRFGPTSCYPAEARRRAQCERWMDWQLSTLSPALGPLYLQLVRTPVAARNAQVIAESRERGMQVLSILERSLATTPYLDGGDLTLADVGTGIWAHRWFSLSDSGHGGLTNVWGWYQRLAERPSFRECVLEVPLE